MDTFEASSNHRNTWPNYPTECYQDYYRSYGTARKKTIKFVFDLFIYFLR
jgi:hypothetical protein